MTTPSPRKKECPEPTKGCDGFAPIFAYVGQEGFAIHVEFRAGSAPSKKGKAAFFAQNIAFARQASDLRPLVRKDAGNDNADNLIVCQEVWLITPLYSRTLTSNWNPSPCGGHYPSRNITVPPPRRIHFNEAVHPDWDECAGSHIHYVRSRCLRSPLYAGKIQGVISLYYPDHRVIRVVTPCARVSRSFRPPVSSDDFGCCR